MIFFLEFFFAIAVHVFQFASNSKLSILDKLYTKRPVCIGYIGKQNRGPGLISTPPIKLTERRTKFIDSYQIIVSRSRHTARPSHYLSTKIAGVLSAIASLEILRPVGAGRWALFAFCEFKILIAGGKTKRKSSPRESLPLFLKM